MKRRSPMNKDISKELVILRARESLTQQQLADKLETSQRTVAAWESGASVPRKTMQVRIAKVFGLPENYFFDAKKDGLNEMENLSEGLEVGDALERLTTEEQLGIIVKSLIESKTRK